MNGSEVVATTADPAFAVNCEGKIIAWNPAASLALGYRRAEILGRCCWTVFEGLDSSSNRYCGKACPIRTMACEGEPIHRTQIFFRSASGAPTPFNMSSIVVGGDHGKEIVHLLQTLLACERQRISEASLPPGGRIKARLSSRQLEVLRHLADGKGTREIAEVLCISTATVRHHVQRILNRLKAHHRLEAVALARRIGLV